MIKQSQNQLIKNPIILALDVDDQREAEKFLNLVGDLVGAIKLGPRLVYRYGSDFVKACSLKAPVFVDNKYFDIPSTMVAAVKASFESGATLVTVHALSGREALAQLAQLEIELNKVRPFKILAVTILTSWDQTSFPESFKKLSVSDHVMSLTTLVKDAGLSGLVCSAHEIELLKTYNLFHDLYVVTPGVRLNTTTNCDQKRVMNPRDAIKAGASALVIGRPILESANPRQTVEDILGSL